MDITQLLAFVVKNDASDLHLSPGNPPIIRVSGKLKRVDMEDLKATDIRTMLYSLMTEEQRAEFEENKEMDFAISYGENARFRVNFFTNREGPAAVFRTIPSIVPEMDSLGLPQVIQKLANLEKGIILVTGPTGSGKSTTLASMIHHINKTMSKHILTIEDPVEFFHTSVKSLINHREVGKDTHSFAKALRSALREDPDVILVGEMRDYETIALALTAAETGHLVLGTLHSSSASKTIDRIIDVFPAAEKEMVRAMLAGSLQAVVAQTLLPMKDQVGRVAAFEVLIGTHAVRNLIRENQIAQISSMIQTGSRYGMMTMEDSVNSLKDRGLISSEVAATALLKTTRLDGDLAAASGDRPKSSEQTDAGSESNEDDGFSF